MAKPAFRFRAFTALMMLWAFILETISGIVLYIVPPGRIAHWTDWKLWGLSKEDWGAVHTILGYVFLIFALLHIYYNWKPILSYLRRKLRAGLRARTELVVSLFLTLLFTVATLAWWPPFGTIMDIGENLRNSWEENQDEPFMPHAEQLTFREFTQQIGVSHDLAVEILSGRGIQIQDPETDIVKKLAAKHGLSPSDLHRLILEGLSPEEQKKAAAVKAPPKKGGGFGWKTLQDLSQDLDIPLEAILKFFKEKGIEAEPQDILRDLALKHGLKAYELTNEIRGLKD